MPNCAQDLYISRKQKWETCGILLTVFFGSAGFSGHPWWRGSNSQKILYQWIWETGPIVLKITITLSWSYSLRKQQIMKVNVESAIFLRECRSVFMSCSGFPKVLSLTSVIPPSLHSVVHASAVTDPITNWSIETNLYMHVAPYVTSKSTDLTANLQSYYYTWQKELRSHWRTIWDNLLADLRLHSQSLLSFGPNWNSICLSHERTWGILFKSRYTNVRIIIIIIIIKSEALHGITVCCHW